MLAAPQPEQINSVSRIWREIPRSCKDDRLKVRVYPVLWCVRIVMGFRNMRQWEWGRDGGGGTGNETGERERQFSWWKYLPEKNYTNTLLSFCLFLILQAMDTHKVRSVGRSSSYLRTERKIPSNWEYDGQLRRSSYLWGLNEAGAKTSEEPSEWLSE